MRKNQLIAAATLLVLALGLGFFFWPRASHKASTEEGGKASSAALDARREARHKGTVNSAPAKVSGRVIDDDTQAGIAGATVSLTLRRIDGGLYGKAGQSAAPLVAVTDAKGHFEIADLPPGRYSLSATGRQYKPSYQDGILVEGGAHRDNIEFRLHRGGHILSGTVSDIGGGPVGFATVRARDFSEFSIGSLFRAPFSTTTDGDGKYELYLDDGSYRVDVFHADYRNADDNVPISGQDRVVDFILTPGSVIEGVVLRRSDDSPVAGAMVTSNSMGETGGFTVSGISFEGGAESDADGHFSLRGLGSGAFELRAVARNASSREPTIVELGIAESVSDVTVYVDAAYTVSGFVVNKKDDAIAESDVMVGAYNFSPGAVFAASAPSASDGYFEIHGVHPGDYTVGAAAEERQPNFFGESITVVDKDISDLIVTVDPGNTITGRVQPPQEAQLTLTVKMEEMGFSTIMQSVSAFMVSARSNAEGEFTLKGVGVGSFTVVAKADSGAEGKLPLEITGDVDGIVVNLEPRASASGIVVDERGNPVDGATVDFESLNPGEQASINMRGPGGGGGTLTGMDGRFVHKGLADGKYEVTISDGAQLAWASGSDEEKFEAKPVTVEKGQDLHDLRFVVETRDHQITGSVTGPDGAPLADAWVTAQLSRGKDDDIEVSDEDEGDGKKSRQRQRRWRQWGPPEPPVLTDENGLFTVSKLRAGNYDLSAEGLRGGAKGKKDNVPVDTQVSIAVDNLAALTGEVTHGGAPLKDYVVSVEGPNDRRVHVVRDDGVYRLPRLEAGEYAIKVSSELGSASAKATLKTGADTVANLKLANFGSITGTLLDATTGEPLVGIAAVATIGNDGAEWTENAIELMTGGGPRTDKEGKFRVGKLGAGDGQLYLFDPKAKGFSMIATKDFKLEPGQSLDLGTLQGVVPNRVAKDKRGTLGIFRTQVATHAASECADQDVGSSELGDQPQLWIIKLKEGGPAAEAGAKSCDRVVHVQGVDLQVGAQALEQLLTAEVEAGATVTVGVSRKSGETTLSIKAVPVQEPEP